MISKRIILFAGLWFLLLISKAFAHHPGYTTVGTGELKRENVSSAPMLNSLTATTLGKYNLAGGFTFGYVNFDQIAVQEAHELHEEGREIHGKKHEEYYNMHLGFGALEDLDLFLVAPIVSKASNQVEDEDHLGRDERATGFGDIRLLGKYRFWKRGIEAALVAGVKFPTGETAERDRSGAKFDPEQQPGTGSWDGEFGIAVSRSFKRRFSLATSFQYHLRTEGGQQFDAGDIFQYAIGAGVTLKPLGEYPNAQVSVELNNEWARRDHEQGMKTFDSGGTTISVTPGISIWPHRRIAFFWAMPVPIYQNLGGRHEEVEYQILTGVNLSL